MKEITRVINLQITHILSRGDEIVDAVEVNKDKDAAGVAEWLKEKLLADDVVVEGCNVFVMEVDDAGDNGDIPTGYNQCADLCRGVVWDKIGGRRMIIEQEVLGRTFTKEEIMEKATDLLRRNQQDFTTDASHADLVYTVAYNDGVIDLMTELIKEIEA